MPTLIMRYALKTKSRQAGGLSCPVMLRLTFRVLLAPPRFVQSHFLSLDFSRISGHQARRAERALKPSIILDQRTRYAVAHSAGLAALAAAVDVHENVECSEIFRQLEWLAHHHAAGLAREKLVDRLAVHDEAALAGLDEHAR